MKLKTQYLAMFSDKKFLSQEWDTDLVSYYVKKAKRKNALRFQSKKELQEALLIFFKNYNLKNPCKVLVLEEWVIDKPINVKI